MRTCQEDKACRDWSMTAVAGLSNYFSMWRLAESIDVANRCLRSNKKCDNQAAGMS